MNILHRVGFKRLGDAVDAFRGVDSTRIYQSLLTQSNLTFFGNSFSFDNGSREFYLEDGYAKNADVYAIIRKIAQTAGSVDWQLLNVLADGTEEVIEDGELFDLIQCPNRLQTRREYVETSLAYLLTTGNEFTAGTRSEGFGEVFREFASLPSEQTELILGNAIEPVRGYVVNGLTQVTFEADEVMHVKYPNPAGVEDERLIGMSPLEAGSRVLQTGNNQQEASASILKNKGASGIISSGSDRAFTKEQGDEMQSKFNSKFAGGDKFGMIGVTSASIDYTQIGMSPTDLRIIDNQVITLRQLCNIFSVDSSLFNDPANKTFNNRKEATKALYNEAVLPNLGMLMEGLNSWLLPGWSRQDNRNYKLIPDTSNIEALQADQKEEAEKDKVKMEGVNIILNMPISPEAKAELLKTEYDYSEEQAKIITNEDNRGEAE